MSTEPMVRLIKNAERKDAKIRAEIKSAAKPNRWPTTVRSWVIEFQHRRGESPPAFDSLFKRAG